MRPRLLGLSAFLLFALVCLTSHGGSRALAEEAEAVKPLETDEVEQALQQSGEKFQFQAEVNRLMDIIIHSLYKTKEIFLRELISNASDALDKIRFLAIGKEDQVLGDKKALEIQIEANKEARTLTIRDTGVGMTKKDLVLNLGTVAKSGTSSFVEALAAGKGDISQIGQFGVGFYSIYLVADKVRVVSKNNDDDQYVWESTADGVFTVIKDPRGNTLGRGTEITLHLKEEDGNEFTAEDQLEQLILRYSEFITFPISLKKTKTKEVEVEAEEEEEGEAEEEGGEEEEAAEGETEEASKTEKKTVTTQEFERINNNVAIWARSPKDVTGEEYENFYKGVTKDWAAPLTWIHFKAEGEMEFRSILFTPGEPPYDLYDNYYTRHAQLRLYVKKVLISDEFQDLLPRYMNFVKGMVDSDDLPLNVSRETLQQHKLLKVMAKKLTRKVLEMLRRLAEKGKKTSSSEEDEEEEQEDKKSADDEEEGDNEKYIKFWEAFGKSIKLGVIEDSANRSKLVKLLRFKSSKSFGKWVSLENYVKNMKDWQEDIYYIAGETIDAVEKSPFLEKFKNKGIEVLYLVDTVDEYAIQNVNEFEGKKLQSVTKEGLKFGDEDEKLIKRMEKYYKHTFKPLVEYLKKTLQGKIREVSISHRVESAPSVIVTGKYGHSANMERIMRNQAMQDSARMAMFMSQKTMEINPRHPIVDELNRRVIDNPDSEVTKDYAWLLYDTALLESGFQHDDAQDFSSRVLKSMKQGLHVSHDGLLSEPDLPDEEEDEEGEVIDIGSEPMVVDSSHPEFGDGPEDEL